MGKAAKSNSVKYTVKRPHMYKVSEFSLPKPKQTFFSAQKRLKIMGNLFLSSDFLFFE